MAGKHPYQIITTYIHSSLLLNFSVYISEQQTRTNRNMARIATINKKVENEFSEVDKIKELNFKMYEDIHFWKTTWINQIAKIRQLTEKELNIVKRIVMSPAETIECHSKIVNKFISCTSK